MIGGVDLPVGEALADRIGTLGDAPLAVITAGRQDNFPRTPTRLVRSRKRLWVTMHDELAGLSHDSVYVVALRSDHDVPWKRPAAGPEARLPSHRGIAAGCVRPSPAYIRG